MRAWGMEILRIAILGLPNTQPVLESNNPPDILEPVGDRQVHPILSSPSYLNYLPGRLNYIHLTFSLPACLLAAPYLGTLHSVSGKVRKPKESASCTGQTKVHFPPSF